MNCNVLIVDDSPILRAAMKKTIRLAGIDENHIHQAGDGREALRVLETVRVDLVLLDLNMPVMNGEEFVEALREKPDLSNVIIVIVSTESNNARLARLRELGVKHTLSKPFEPEDLCHLVAHAVGVNG